MRDINLLPEDNKVALKENVKETTAEVPKEKKEGRTHVKAVILGIAVVVAIAATLAAPRVYMRELDAAAAGLTKMVSDPKYNETNTVNKQLEIMNKQLELKKEVIKDIDKISHPLTEIFTSLRHACPKGCYITGMDFDGKKIRISGVASDSLLAAEFMSNLDSLDNLKKDSSSESLSVGKVNASIRYSFTYNIGSEGGK